MKNWSLGYALLKVFVQFAFRLSHKRIIVLGKKNIPKNKPIIFAPNHQNALMDPLAVLCTNHTQPVWLARADIFKKKSTRSILRFLKIMPVYRIRDGKSNLGMNDEIFNQAIEVLENKKALALFPEAAHSGKRQMLPHKKAIPRIAFLAEEKSNFQLHLQVVPVGIYYSHYWHFNRTLVVNYGQPISVDEYQSEYENNPQQAALLLRDEIRKRIEPLTININSEYHYDNYELFRELVGDQFASLNKQHKNKTKNRFFNDQKLIHKLESNEEKLPDLFIDLHKNADQFRKLLNQYQLSTESIKKRNLQLATLFIHAIVVLLISPILLAGFLFHAIPFLIPRFFIQKKVKDSTFYSSFHFVACMIAYFLYEILLGGIILVISGKIIWSIIAILLLIIVGKLAHQLLEYSKKVIKRFHFYTLNKKEPKQVQRLLNLKEKMITQIMQVMQEKK